MKFKKIIVTGAAGYLGSRFCSWLKAQTPSVEVIAASRADLQDVSELLARTQPDCVFHFAGRVLPEPGLGWGSFYKDNVDCTLQLLEAVKKADLKTRIVIPGSAAEYGLQKAEDSPWCENLLPRPVSPYGASKAWQTTAALHYATQGVDVVVGRIFNPIGEGLPVRLAPGNFAAQILAIQNKNAERVLKVGNLETERDFVDATDACSALGAIAERGHAGEVYNVCSGKLVSIRQLLDEMIRVSSVGDVRILESVEKNRRQDILSACGSPKKTFSDLGWKASVSLNESVTAMLKSGN